MLRAENPHIPSRNAAPLPTVVTVIVPTVSLAAAPYQRQAGGFRQHAGGGGQGGLAGPATVHTAQLPVDGSSIMVPVMQVLHRVRVTIPPPPSLGLLPTPDHSPESGAGRKG